MKAKLLKKLRNKHQIRYQEVDVIKILYSVTPLHHTINGDPDSAIWCSYSLDEAKKKQRELILKSLHNPYFSITL